MIARRKGLKTVVFWDAGPTYRLDRLGNSLPELVRLAGELDATGIGFESLTEKIDATTVPASARGHKGGRPALLPEKAAAIQAMVASDRPVMGICKVHRVERSTLNKCASGLTVANVDARSPIPEAGGIAGTRRRHGVS